MNAELLKKDITKLMDTFLQQTGIPNSSITDKKLLEMYEIKSHPNVSYTPVITVENFNGIASVQNGRKIVVPHVLPEDEYVVSIEPIFENEGIKENYGAGNDQIRVFDKLRLKMITNYGRCFQSKYIFPNRLPKSLQENSPGVYGECIYKNSPNEKEVAERLTYKMPSIFAEFLHGYLTKSTTKIQTVNEKFYKLIGQFDGFLTDELHIHSSKLATTIQTQKKEIETQHLQIKDLQVQLQQQNQTNASQTSRIGQLEGEISGFKTTIQNMEKVIADLRLQIQHNQRTIQTLEAKIKEKDTSLADYEAYIRVKKRQNME